MITETSRKIGLNDFSTIHRWVLSRHALGWPIAVAVLINTAVTGFVTAPVEATAPSGINIHVVDFASGAVAAIAILVGQRFKNYRTTVGLTFAFWIVIAAVASVVSGILLQHAPGKSWMLTDFLVIASATLSLTLVMLGFTLFFAAVSESRASTNELARKRLEFTTLESQLEAAITRDSNEIIENVHNRIIPAIENLKKRLTELAPNAQRTPITDEIVLTINHVVLPLTRELQQDATYVLKSATHEISHDRPSNIRTAKRELYRRSIQSRLASKRKIRDLFTRNLTLGGFLLLGIPYANYLSGSQGLFSCFLFIALSAVAVSFAVRVIGEVHLYTFIAIPFVIAVFTIPSVIFVFAESLLDSSKTFADTEPMIVLAVLISTVTTLSQSALMRHELALEEARKVIDALALLVSKLRQSSWRTKSRLTRLVHGDVQSLLITSLMRISNNEKFDSSTVELIQRALDEGISKLKNINDTNSLTVFETISAMKKSWSDITDIEFAISEDDIKILESDRVLFGCVFEVCREGIGNAIKHSQARHIDIAINETSIGVLTATVTNDLNVGLRIDSSGSGSRILDEVAHEWKFSINGNRAVLVADFAI